MDVYVCSKAFFRVELADEWDERRILAVGDGQAREEGGERGAHEARERRGRKSGKDRKRRWEGVERFAKESAWKAKEVSVAVWMGLERERESGMEGGGKRNKGERGESPVKRVRPMALWKRNETSCAFAFEPARVGLNPMPGIQTGGGQQHNDTYQSLT